MVPVVVQFVPTPETSLPISAASAKSKRQPFVPNDSPAFAKSIGMTNPSSLNPRISVIAISPALMD